MSTAPAGPQDTPVFFYRQKPGGGHEIFLQKSREGLTHFSLSNQAVLQIIQATDTSVLTKNYTHYFYPLDEATAQSLGGQWVQVNEIGKGILGQKTGFTREFLEQAPKILTPLEGTYKLVAIDLEHSKLPASPALVVDEHENTIIINGEIYRMRYKAGGKELPMSHMSPSEKKKFMEAIGAAARLATEGITAQLEHIVIHFEGDDISNIKGFDDQKNEVVQESGSDKKFDNCRPVFKEFVLKANSGLLSENRFENAILGISQIGQHRSCTFGATMQHLMNAYDLESLLDPTTPDSLIEQLVQIKRILNRESTQPLTEEMIQRAETDLMTRLQLQPDFINPIEIVKKFSLLTTPQKIETIIPSNNSIKDELNRLYQVGTPAPSVISIDIPRFTPTGTSQESLSINDSRLSLPCDDNNVYELMHATIHDEEPKPDGHFITYTFKNNKWWKSDREVVTEVKNKSELLKMLSTKAINLIYKQTPKESKPEMESSLELLHSTSRIDNDKWLDSHLVTDFNKKLSKSTPADWVPLQHPSGRVFRCGNGSDKAALEKAINDALQENPGKKISIPLLKKDRHWVAVVVDPATQKIEYFDSVGRKVPKEILDVANALNPKYTVEKVLEKGTKWQEDGFRCGYFTLEFLHLRKQRDVKDIRALGYHPRDVSHVQNFRSQLIRQYNRYQPKYGFE